MMSTIEAIQYRHLSLQAIAELACGMPRSAPGSPSLAADERADNSAALPSPVARRRRVQVADHTYRVVHDDESPSAWELVAPEAIEPLLYRDRPRERAGLATVMLLYASLSTMA